MKLHLRYLWYVLRHKWFVLVAGWRIGVPLWQLITHDWSKFLPREWGPYAAYFYSGRPKMETQAAFDRAWNYHQKQQPHHWQHWVLVTDRDDPRIIPLAMPERYIREMVADWAGAGRAITGRWEVCEWYQKNRERIYLHPATRDRVETLLRFW